MITSYPIAKRGVNMRNYNLKRDPKDERDFMFSELNLPKQVPSMVDLRRFMPPVVNQGNSGTCQTCAVLSIDQYINKYTWIPSIPFGYYCLHDVEDIDHSEDCGGTLRDTIKTTIKYGVCNSEVWSNEKDWREKPTDEAYTDGINGNDALKKYYSVGKDKEQMKQAIADNNLVFIGVEVYPSFESEECLKTGIVPLPSKSEKPLGGHALVVVGYDNTKNWFIIRNSWGTEIGDNGYFFIPYKVWDIIGWESWVIIQ
jgi:C1A family cysteine protease